MGNGDQQGSGYRVPAPVPDARVQWPDDFGTRFTIFVDTEEEFDWGAPLSADADGTRHMAALPPVHARFAAAGAALTYLIDYPIATSPLAIEVLREVIRDGRSAIGTQLHPWVNPPHVEDVNGFNSFTGNLPLELQRAKLVALTEAVERAAGRRPLVYRAGRYGIGPDTPALLAELGYRIDSSMRSAYDYSDEGGPDFSAVPNDAFRIGSLIELPFTTVFTGRMRRGGAALHRGLGRLPHGIGVASRLGLLSRVALTPEDMPLGEAKEAIRVAVGEGLRLLNFAFHSPSVEPGHTPYVRTEADLAAFLRWWDEVLALLDRLGVRSASVDEIVAAACRPA
ncbi:MULTISPECIES: polysaccharide deacetylase family protein [unclassified Sphingomonas]|uniref:polysaccharide deacetylase family protein n=1 Tax=unclassified Sphingomonas TaxID=196159 RepID=UPI0022B425E1|nr:polysaccharide deacetylase family protein [Sphingomonas sp. NIBR02145]WHU03599.1 polysaccharide deacetylase family protein [Sphingomonas sp. NIBR02145]